MTVSIIMNFGNTAFMYNKQLNNNTPEHLMQAWFSDLTVQN